MITEQLIRESHQHYKELVREAEQYRVNQVPDAPSAMDNLLARAGDLLVAAGRGLQRRYRRMERGVGMTDYANGRRLGRAL